MKKIIVALSLIVTFLLGIGLCACGSSLSGTYYLYEKGSLDTAQYVKLDGKNWEMDTGDTGSYKTDGDQIVLYSNFFGMVTVYSQGTYKKGVLILNDRTYCKEGFLPFETESYRGEEKDEESGLKFLKQKDGYMVTGPISRDIEKAIIPETFHSKPVVAIAKMAFYDCGKLKEIQIPSSVVSIGMDAFCGTIGSAKNDFDPSQWYSSLRTLDGCVVESRRTIGFPDAVKKGTRLLADGAFSQCNMKGRNGIVIAKSVRYIGNDLFGEQDASNFPILFEGTKEEWSKISIGSDNGDWNTAENVYFYSEQQPTDEGNYWRNVIQPEGKLYAGELYPEFW